MKTVASSFNIKHPNLSHDAACFQCNITIIKFYNYTRVIYFDVTSFNTKRDGSSAVSG